MSDVNLFTVMLREQLELPLDRLEELQRLNRRYHTKMTHLIEEGVESGAFAVDQPQLASLFILGAVNWMLQWFRDDGPMAPEDVAAAYSRLVLSGLAAT